MYKILKSYLENRYFLLKYREKYTSLHPVLSGVPGGSVLGPPLYLLYIADLPTTADSTTTIFADDTVILTVHEDLATATHRLQTHSNKIQFWLKKWRMKANEKKSFQVTFTPKKSTCPPVHLKNKQLTQAEDVKYLDVQYIWIENSPGVNTYLQRENNWNSNSANCAGSLAKNHSYHWKTSYSYTKQY
jgi:hypothetical protein